MIEHSYTLLDEPKGTDYSKFLSFLFRSASKYSLVVPSNYMSSIPVQKFLEAAQPYLIEDLIQSSWPGTALQGNATAHVHYYAANWPIFEAMTLATDRLYAWLSPTLPEDPAFYRSDGRLLMGTVSHERDAFLILNELELTELSTMMPKLRVLPNDTPEDMASVR